MTKTPKPIDVPVGTLLPTGVHFIRQQLIEKPNADFSVTLPGNVYCYGEAALQTITPRTRLVIPGQKPVRAVRMSATVTDQLARRRARDALLAQIDSMTPLSFALRFTVKTTFGQAFEAAEAATDCGCGCDCDCGDGAEAALRGAVEIGLAPGAGGNLKWSDPFAAIIYLGVDGVLDYGSSETAECIAVRDNCTEDWALWNGTTCKGLQCTFPEECRCGDNPDGSAKTACAGWVRCNCNV